jgi:hypothetical protein|tara:strand:- start:2035 stop:2748 length:714 start_codon:yes stop_codon:yes gene_type:complete
MGYLDSTAVTVDAVLTKKGREILARGGNLDITHFSATDTGVDYRLWNPDHPSGSAFYGEAIENLPNFEANVHSEYTLRNRLISLNQNTIAIPALEANGLNGTNVHTFEDGDANGIKLTVTLKGFSAPIGEAAAGGLIFVIYDPTVVHSNAQTAKQLSGVTNQFLREQDIPNVVQYNISGTGPDFTVPVMPDTTTLTSGRETSGLLLHPQTGAYLFVRFVNNITKLTRNVLSSAGTKS